MPNIKFSTGEGLGFPRDVQFPQGTSFGLSISQTAHDEFNERVLGLGDVGKDATYVQALAAIFDLAGFTSFCNQPESHLVVPDFLKRFLAWLFASLKEEATNRKIKSAYKKTLSLYCPLPFFAKFTGDGVLLLWNTNGLSPMQITNQIIVLSNIVAAYRSKFLPEARKSVSTPPHALRCGIARGQIISIGDGEDYVGSCINIASRLQKLSLLAMAISRRGLDLTKRSEYCLKKVELRGIGKGELVYVKKTSFERLPPKEKKKFADP